MLELAQRRETFNKEGFGVSCNYLINDNDLKGKDVLVATHLHCLPN